MAGHSIQHADGSRTFIDYADAEGRAVVNGRVWRWYFHEWGGPLFLRADGEPRKCQCPTVKAVWDAFTHWHKRYERAKRANVADEIRVAMRGENDSAHTQKGRERGPDNTQD